MNKTLPFTCLLLGEQSEYITYLATFISATLPVFIFVGLCYALFWKDKHSIYVLTAAMFISSWIYSIKELTRIDRPRPNCTVVRYLGHTMPSLSSTLVVFFVMYYLYQFWAHARSVWSLWALFMRSLILIGYALLVCFSRMVSFHSFPEDVLVGSILGSISAVLFIFGMRRHADAQYKSTLKSD